MLLTLQVTSVLLASVAMALALAHALELPGKLRLDKDAYLMVQKIYYPGFTVGGFGEVLGLLAIAGLLVVTPSQNAAFGWTLAGFGALLAMYGTYWILTHPVNKFWLKDHEMKGLGSGFFGISPESRGRTSDSEGDDWKRYRNRWELSHIVRAAFAMFSLILLVVAIAL